MVSLLLKYIDGYCAEVFLHDSFFFFFLFASLLSHPIPDKVQEKKAS